MHKGILYLSGVRNELTDSLVNYHSNDLPLGLLVQPLTVSYLEKAHLYHWCGIDNGCFSSPQRFSLKSYLKLISDCFRKFGDNTLFATAPDVFDITTGKGNWQATIAKSLPVLPQIRQRGVPAAIVAQDGATPYNTPWDAFDCLFIGASTEWKLSNECRIMCHEARRRGKWVHMGRVNSMTRMHIAFEFGGHSVDGTHLLYHEERAGVENILSWLRSVSMRDYVEGGWYLFEGNTHKAKEVATTQGA